ncbi:MAG: enoyl-CoA hydratase-related protein [Halovenus sp.]
MSSDLEATGADCDTLTVSVDDPAPHAVTITLDRPDARNAMSQQLRREFKRVLDEVEKSTARVVVVTGSEESRAFASGADLTEVSERSSLEQRELSKRPRVYEALASLNQPVIARINGLALGGGCELALACDIRYADTNSRFGFPEVSLGLIPGGGGTQRLARLVGEGQAMRLILTGELLDAASAEDLGIVEGVYEPADLDEQVEELATTVAGHSPVALEFAKRAVRASSQLGLEDGIDYEAELFAQVLASDDAREGMDAFLNDREPEWTGE